MMMTVGRTVLGVVSDPVWLILFVLVVCDRVLMIWQHALAIRQSYDDRRDTGGCSVTSSPSPPTGPSSPRQSSGWLGRPREFESELVIRAGYPPTESTA